MILKISLISNHQVMVYTYVVTASGTGPITVDTYAWQPPERSIFTPPEDRSDLIVKEEGEE